VAQGVKYTIAPIPCLVKVACLAFNNCDPQLWWPSAFVAIDPREQATIAGNFSISSNY